MNKILDQYPHEQKVKAKKNVLYLTIFSIVMLFAGLTSAYIVVQKDNFWVSVDMPMAFWASTIVIIISSVTMVLAKIYIEKNYTLAKVFIGISVVLGMTFSVLQWNGWKALIGKGSFLVMPIVNSKGKYAEPYTFYKNDQQVKYQNNEYFINDQPISSEDIEDMKGMAKAFQSTKNDIDLSQWYSKGWALYHNQDLVVNIKGKLLINDSIIDKLQSNSIFYFADNIINDRGDFYLKGQYGKDFTLTYQGKDLEYKDRKFYVDGKEMSPALYDKLNDSQNTASSFLYLFTGMHLLHLIFGIIFLVRLFIITLKNDFNPDINLKLKLGSIYWHFVDGLWIYLYLFLLFIH